ncbi:unnamed protein product [Peniophora sp. CBMAI 1063]|nr:unnamed protein product [Peniophora sp. CBMAI 1063]
MSSEEDEEMPYDPDSELEWARDKLEKTADSNAEVYEHLKDICHRFQLENYKLRQRLSDSTPDALRDLRDENRELKSQVASLHQENQKLQVERDESARQLQRLYQRLQLVLAETFEATSYLAVGQSNHPSSPHSPATLRPRRPPSLPRPSSRASVATAELVDTTCRTCTTRTHASTPPPSRPVLSHSPSSTTALGAPFTDARDLVIAGPNSAKKGHLYGGQPRMRTRVRSGDFGSPMRVPSTSALTVTNRMTSLTSSPGAISEIEGPSVQYDHDHSQPSASPSTRGTSSSRPKWRIHFAKAPTTSRIATSFVTQGTLSSTLGFDRDIDNVLSSLGQREPNSMRLVVREGYGFIFDPVVLENPRATYLVDWGDVIKNDEVTRYIASLTANDSTLHTFIYSAKNLGWLYLGHCEWDVTEEVGTVWSMLNSAAQKTLAGRRAAQRSPAQFLHKLAHSELVQLVVHLKPVDDVSQEQAVLRRLQQAISVTA